MSINIEKILESEKFDDFLKNAEEALLRSLDSNPKDFNKLWRLGEIYRQKGQLTNALNCYKEILIISPDHIKSKYLFHLFNKDLSFKIKKPEHHLPNPFQTFSDFLNHNELNKVWDLTIKNHGNFKDAMVGNGIGNNKIMSYKRHSKSLNERHITEISTLIIEKIKTILSNNYENLLIQPFEISRKEIMLTTHQDGHFLTTHKDVSLGKFKTRKVTFVYYFFNEPKQFQGGDLILFDTNPINDSYSESFTRLIPQNNMLLLFPSEFYHKVTPIRCKNNDFKNGRFTINGWFYDDDNSSLE